MWWCVYCFKEVGFIYVVDFGCVCGVDVWVCFDVGFEVIVVEVDLVIVELVCYNLFEVYVMCVDVMVVFVDFWVYGDIVVMFDLVWCMGRG